VAELIDLSDGFADSLLRPLSLAHFVQHPINLVLLLVLELRVAYIQNWLGGASIPGKSAQKIFATAAAILKAGQEKPQQKGEEDTAT
jgi:hypothetical protein